jgi:hypothetical protein
MPGRTARSRLLGSALARATIAFGLAACGGGGGGGVDPSGGGGTPVGPESALLLADFVAQDVNHQYVRVWDPVRPGTAVQMVRISSSNGTVWTSSHLVFSDATQVDPASRTATTAGHVRAYFDNDGKLYTIDLRGGRSHAPVQLSSATDVTRPVSVTTMSADGTDAWIDARGGTHDWAIRSTMAATDAPISILGIVAPLRDASTGLPQYLFTSYGTLSGTAMTPTTYAVVDPAFHAVAEPTVATMGSYDGWVGADPSTAGLGYVRVANALLAIRWSAGGVAVDAAHDLHDFHPGLLPPPVAADARSLYVADLDTLLAVGNGVVGTVGSFSAAPAALTDAGGYVAATLVPAAGAAAVETLRKSDGAHALLEPQTAGLQVLGGGAQGVVLTGTASAGAAFEVVSGDGATRRTAGSQAVGLVRSASAPWDGVAAPVALLSCTAAGAAAGHCSAGPLAQLDLGSGASLTLVELASSTPLWLRGDAIQGLEASFGAETLGGGGGVGFDVHDVDARDALQFTPGGPGLAGRVTTYVP